jgi:peptidoglycan LD-endopeptidase CwlK
MNPPQNRDLNALHPLFRAPLERWLAEVRAAGLPIRVYETFRTPARQAYLYAQGRTRPGAVVTYTLDSCHRYGTACDWAPLIGGQLSWALDAYERIYKAVPPEHFGLETLDFERPHIQLAGGQQGAQRLGIVRDVLVGSVWPAIVQPASVSRPVAVVTAPAHQGAVLVPDPAGGWRDVSGQRLELPPTEGGYILNATGASVYLAPNYKK